MNEYRVFISYAHGDEDLVSKVERILIANGLQPMRDKNFAIGTGFDEQIKAFIAHAHVFLPIITESSYNRGWVHQEIGYAIALNVPVLPIAVGTVAGEMLQNLNALLVPKEKAAGELVEIGPALSLDVFDNLVSHYRENKRALYACAEYAEDRTQLMIDYAESVLRLRYTGLVRQKGALSSFHIPDRVINHPIWRERYGGRDRGPHHCTLQRNERIALEKHARKSGCRLIVDPSLEYSDHGPSARIVRLRSLVEFLESMPDDKVEVAIDNNIGYDLSITIVGEWFYAESVSASSGHGYRQTIFTRHAPSMRSKTEVFDQEFADLLARMNWTREGSRAAAIKYLQDLIRKIPSKIR